MLIEDKILDSIDTGILVVDKDMKVVSMNSWFNVHANIEKSKVLNKQSLDDIFDINNIDIRTLKRYIKSTLLLKTPGFISAMTHGSLFKIPYLSILKSNYTYMQTSTKFVFLEDNRVAIILTDKTPLISAYDIVDNKKDILEMDLNTLRQSNTLLESEINDITRKAYYDELTGLGNRRNLIGNFEERLSHQKENKSSFAVLFFDLDEFKEINDRLGHDVGDGVLISIANELKESIKNVDMVARLGGDEFIMLLSSIQDKKEIQSFIENLIQSLAQKRVSLGNSVQVTVSVGISICPKDGEDIKTLLKNSDKALYDAKAKGKNTFSFFEDEEN